MIRLTVHLDQFADEVGDYPNAAEARRRVVQLCALLDYRVRGTGSAGQFYVNMPAHTGQAGPQGDYRIEEVPA